MEIFIQGNDSLPIYEQIVREMKKAIVKGELLPGDMLPSIRSLARDLEISVITTKRAYEELEKQELIFSVAGKGFYVKEPNKERLREEQLHKMEMKFAQAIREGRELGLSKEDMKMILDTLYEGGN